MRNEIKELIRHINAIELTDRHYVIIMIILSIFILKISPIP